MAFSRNGNRNREDLRSSSESNKKITMKRKMMMMKMVKMMKMMKMKMMKMMMMLLVMILKEKKVFNLI